MSSRGLLDIKQNTGTGAESLQEQLGTILVQNPNPTLGAQDNHTHPDIQDGAGQNNLRFMLFGSRSTSDLVVDVGVGVEGALALVLGETLWFRDKGLTDAQRIGRHTQGLHSPLTGALLLSGPGSSELRTR